MTDTTDIEIFMLSMTLQQCFVEKYKDQWGDHTGCRSAKQTPKTTSYGVPRPVAHYMVLFTYQLKYRRKSRYTFQFVSTIILGNDLFRFGISPAPSRCQQRASHMVTNHNSPILLDWTNSPRSMVWTNTPVLWIWTTRSNCVSEHQRGLKRCTSVSRLV